METGVYVVGFLAGIGLAFGVAFMFAVFHASFVILTRIIDP